MKDASERDRINMEDAKAVEKANKDAERIAKLAAKEQSATSKSMSDAVSEFGRAVTTNSQHAIQAARLEIKNPQMSFFRGGSDHVDQDPTGQKYLRQAYPEYYQPVRIHEAGSTQKQFDTSNMPDLGVLYLASQDGKNMVKVFTEPANVKIIKQIAVQGINEMVRDGAVANT